MLYSFAFITFNVFQVLRDSELELILFFDLNKCLKKILFNYCKQLKVYFIFNLEVKSR